MSELRAAVVTWDAEPAILRVADLARIFGLSSKRIYSLHSEGAFTCAEIRPRIGRLSWDRERLRRYISGDLKGLAWNPRLTRRAG